LITRLRELFDTGGAGVDAAVMALVATGARPD
jgi:hypothetical protein